MSATLPLDLSPLPATSAPRGTLNTQADIVRFLEAGRAILTIRSRRSGERFTYRFRRPDATDDQAPAARPIFVSVLRGPDNSTDYVFIGTIFPTSSVCEVRPSRATKVGANAPSAKAVRWFLECAYGGDRGAARLTKLVEVWHEGRCGRCGRLLTVPESVRRGIGPECAGRLE